MMDIFKGMLAGLFGALMFFVAIAGAMLMLGDTTATDLPIIGAIFFFGGIIAISLLTIANKLHEQKELLEAQLEEAQKTNRALAAIYKRQDETMRKRKQPDY